MVGRDRWRTKIVIPDVHVPYQHKAAIRNLTGFIGDVQPDEVAILGDFADFKAVARWSRDLPDEVESNLQDEFDQASAVLAGFRAQFAGPIKFMNGNHENRLENYMRQHAKGLLSLRCLSVAEQLRLPDLGIEHFDGTVPYEIAPDWWMIHGLRLRQQAGLSAYAMLALFGHSVVQGHSHRAGIVPLTTDKRRFAMECGHLSDVTKQAYLDFRGVANWQLAFGMLHIKGDRVVPQLIWVQQDGSFLYDGREVGA